MAEHPQAAIPERVGRYLVQEVIGTGGFATVYRARDERLDVDVAVKVLAENHSIDPDLRERFILEGQRLRRVGGPHILEVYDLGDTERAQPYLVLQWADRGDLAARTAVARTRGYRPTPHDALAVARMLASALGTLHRHDVIHRDLAPKNLLLSSVDQDDDQLTEEEARRRVFAGSARAPADRSRSGLVAADEELLLADLGMSKDLAKASGFTVAAGTSGFAPPEQRDHGNLVDRRADIWAASALLVWLATGNPPDDAARWREQIPPAGWPPPVIPALERGLAVDPGQRHPTIEDWAGDLERLLDPPPPPAPVPVPVAPLAAQATQTSETRKARRSRAVLVAAVVGLAVGGVGSAVAVDALGSDSPSADVSVAIDGPATATVGESVTFSADVEDGSEWVWVAPDGTFQSGPTLSFEPTSAGRLTVRLVATDDQGRAAEASHRVQVAAE